MSSYFSEFYFFLLVSVVFGYVAVWLVAWGLALLGTNKSGGNPYVNIYNSWIGAFLAHTIFIAGFISYTIIQMLNNDHAVLLIFFYNIGFFVLMALNFIMIFRLNVRKRSINK